MNRKSKENSNSIGAQSTDLCWQLESLESTISFGFNLKRKFPQIKILLLQGPLGAGKTSLVKGIAKSAGILEPITSPTFALSQHYLEGKPPLVHLDLYRIENQNDANELFYQEEEEALSIDALMVIEWPERLSISITDAWIGKIQYNHYDNGRTIELIPPLLPLIEETN